MLASKQVRMHLPLEPDNDHKVTRCLAGMLLGRRPLVAVWVASAQAACHTPSWRSQAHTAVAATAATEPPAAIGCTLIYRHMNGRTKMSVGILDLRCHHLQVQTLDLSVNPPHEPCLAPRGWASGPTLVNW
jgi:hypothetical protein